MHWHFGNTLSQPKEAAVTDAAFHWTNANSEFYFQADGDSPNHVGEHSDDCYPVCGIPAHQHDTSYTSGSPFHFLESDVHLNSDLNGEWNNNTNSCPNGFDYDTEGITTHEMGHSVGLDHPAQAGNPMKTMWAEDGNPGCYARTLESSDVDGMNAIYDDSPGD